MRGTCRCRVYTFPHRFLAGQCTGISAVERVFETGQVCIACPHSLVAPAGVECAVLNSGKYMECPGLLTVVKVWT